MTKRTGCLVRAGCALAEEKKTEVQDKKPSQIGFIFTMSFVVINVVVLGVGLFFAYKGTIGWDAPVYTEEQAFERLKFEQDEMEKLPLIFTLDSFKANLNDNPVRAIEVEVSVEMMNREGYEELIDSDNQARVRDEVLRILQNKSYDDVSTVQGKLFLKDQFSASLNSILKQGIVKEIFFSQFKIE